MKKNENLSAIKHGISAATAKKYISAFQQKFTAADVNALSYYESFNKEAILKLINKDDCIGLRIYNGLKTKAGKKEVVFVLMGINKDGSDVMSGAKIKANFVEPKDDGDDEDPAANNGQRPPANG
jgi:hypothetical protein